MPYCAANGTELYYEIHGAGAPIVCIHGSGGNHASWYRQIPDFAKTHRVIAYDQRGFGNTEDQDGRGRSSMVEDLGALVDHLGIERAVLVAQSLGGGAGIGYACRHPGRVAGLVMCDTLVGIKLPPELAAIMSETNKRTANLTQPERVLGPATRARSPEMALLYTQLASFNTYRVATIPGTFTPVTIAEIAASRVPLTFVLGADDVLFPPDCIRRVHALLPGSDLVEIAGAGHSAYFEDAASFNRHLRAFLAKLDFA